MQIATLETGLALKGGKPLPGKAKEAVARSPGKVQTAENTQAARLRGKNLEAPKPSPALAEKLAKLPQGADFPHNPANPGKGSISYEPGASLSPQETRAAQAFEQRGYDVCALKEVADTGVKSVGTPDLHIDGFGRVEVYSPKTSNLDRISQVIEKKGKQSLTLLIQIDCPMQDMNGIAKRVFGKPNRQNMTFMFFEPGTGKLHIFKKQ